MHRTALSNKRGQILLHNSLNKHYISHTSHCTHRLGWTEIFSSEARLFISQTLPQKRLILSTQIKHLKFGIESTKLAFSNGPILKTENGLGHSLLISREALILKLYTYTAERRDVLGCTPLTIKRSPLAREMVSSIDSVNDERMSRNKQHEIILKIIWYFRWCVWYLGWCC